MSTVYVVNAFSLGMLTESSTLYVYRVDLYNAITLLKGGFTSAIGHEATAEVMSQLTGISIPMNRTAISLKKGDIALVFQLGTRLPEGKILSSSELKDLPHTWYIVRID